MVIETTRFGGVEYQKEKIITFSSGIPGFKHFQSYIIVTLEESPFHYLQSVDEGSLAFITVNPFDFIPKYEFELPEQVKEEMNIQSEDSLQVLNIVNVQGELATATINLAAPIIINTAERIGMQYILPDSNYSIHHSLFAEALKEKGE